MSKIQKEAELYKDCPTPKLKRVILNYKLLSYSNLEVQKSALQTAIQTDIIVSTNKIKEIEKNADLQIKNLLLKY